LTVPMPLSYVAPWSREQPIEEEPGNQSACEDQRNFPDHSSYASSHARVLEAVQTAQRRQTPVAQFDCGSRRLACLRSRCARDLAHEATARVIFGLRFVDPLRLQQSADILDKRLPLGIVLERIEKRFQVRCGGLRRVGWRGGCLAEG